MGGRDKNGMTPGHAQCTVLDIVIDIDDDSDIAD